MPDDNEIPVSVDDVEIVEEVRIKDPEVVKKLREAKEAGLEGRITISW